MVSGQRMKRRHINFRILFWYIGILKCSVFTYFTFAAIAESFREMTFMQQFTTGELPKAYATQRVAFLILKTA